MQVTIKLGVSINVFTGPLIFHACSEKTIYHGTNSAETAIKYKLNVFVLLFALDSTVIVV